MSVFQRVLLTVLGLIVFAGCKSKESNQQQLILEIPVSAVSAQNIPVNYEFTGQMRGSVDAEIRARVDGELTGLHFQEGKEVTEGQLLYTINPAPFKAKLSQASAKLAEEEARLVKASADLKRIRPLAEINAVSKRDLDAAIASERAASSSVAAAKAVVESAQIELGYTEIRSPVSGKIGLTKARVGEYVGKPPNSVVLNTVSRTDPILVRISLSESEYLHFVRIRERQSSEEIAKQNEQLELFLADNSKYEFPGRLESVDSAISRDKGTLAVDLSFPNPRQLLRPGQFARIRVVAETLKDALLVPKRAIYSIQGKTGVFVVDAEGVVKLTPVVLGPETAQGQVISSGVSPGQRVAVDGVLKLRDGMKVRAVSS